MELRGASRNASDKMKALSVSSDREGKGQEDALWASLCFKTERAKDLRWMFSEFITRPGCTMQKSAEAGTDTPERLTHKCDSRELGHERNLSLRKWRTRLHLRVHQLSIWLIASNKWAPWLFSLPCLCHPCSINPRVATGLCTGLSSELEASSLPSTEASWEVVAELLVITSWEGIPTDLHSVIYSEACLLLIEHRKIPRPCSSASVAVGLVFTVLQ